MECIYFEKDNLWCLVDSQPSSTSLGLEADGRRRMRERLPLVQEVVPFLCAQDTGVYGDIH